MTRSGKTGRGSRPARDREAEQATHFRVVDRRHTHAGTEDAGEPSGEYPTVVEDFRRRAEEAEEKLREYIAAYRKEREDLEGLRKRLRADAEARGREALGRSLGRFLEVLDNLDRAIDHTPTDDPLREGVERTRDLLQQIFSDEGVERVEPLGEVFDPEVAEAMLTRVCPPGENGTVIEILRPGYRFDGKLLRAAQVVVGRHDA